MYLITNRRVNEGKKGVSLLGDEPNQKGPNELRLVEAKKKGGKWQLTVLKDELTNDQKTELGLAKNRKYYASHLAAIKTIERARKEKKSILFFVHGFNNDVKSVLDRAESLEKLYNLIVIPFSWPANGGGIKGVVSYRDDKRDAFDRATGRSVEIIRLAGEISLQIQPFGPAQTGCAAFDGDDAAELG